MWYDSDESRSADHLRLQALRLEKKAKRMKNMRDKQAAIRMIVWLQMQAEAIEGEAI